MAEQLIQFNDGAAYERMMGQWSRLAGDVFLDWLAVESGLRCLHKAPIHLDLFIPREHDYDYKVIVTNKTVGPATVVAFHEGRGSQDGIFAELKTECQMDYIPVATEVGNQLYRSAAILAHNLTRELQMKVDPRQRRTTPKRAALWRFSELETLRRPVIQRAGRILRPAGKLILSMDSNERLETELTHYIETMQHCAA